jgi:peptidyl-tRNA hydrolase, PTH1 family
VDFLVVGLGNPGVEYERTPHNLGFLVVDHLALRNGGIRVTRPECSAFVGHGRIAGRDVLLAKPQTFMNLSGPSVKKLLDKYSLPPERLILVYDEMDLPWTALRIKKDGSAAGHNGVKSVIGSLGTQQFPRVRMGIDPSGDREKGADSKRGASLVLGAFRPSQAKDVEELISYSAEAVESIIAEGAEKAMTRYNRRARGSNEEAK